MTRSEALEFVFDQLDHTNQKWQRADGDWPSHVWKKFTILGEEVGEVAMGLNDNDMANVKVELAQVAAVCIHWLMSEFHSKNALAANVC